MAGLRGRKNYVQAAVDALNAGDLSTPIEPKGTAAQRKIMRGLEKLRVTALEQQIAHARAIEQNKLAIASVAHDVKTPLALISGYAECLQDGMDDKDYLALITEKTEQLNGLVLKLVETSKHEIDEIDSLKEKVNTRAFFGAVLSKYEALAKSKNLSYKVRHIPSAEIYADRKELERVFQNLVSNAVKYTEEGGKIASLRLDQQDAGQISAYFGSEPFQDSVVQEKIEKAEAEQQDAFDKMQTAQEEIDRLEEEREAGEDVASQLEEAQSQWDQEFERYSQAAQDAYEAGDTQVQSRPEEAVEGGFEAEQAEGGEEPPLPEEGGVEVEQPGGTEEPPLPEEGGVEVERIIIG